MNNTPNSNRTHITILGRRNVGKSSLINAMTKQETSLVSEVLGTTTDPVQKAIEIHPLGACLIIDTAGIDDVGELGAKRVERTKEMLLKTDVAIVCFFSEITQFEKDMISLLNQKKIPYLAVVTKCDVEDSTALLGEIAKTFSTTAIAVSAKTGSNIRNVSEKLSELIEKGGDKLGIVDSFVQKNDVVLLVMPQDIQAPKGRLILPQVQTIRDLLDNKCVTVCCTKDNFALALESLKTAPKLIITDSQIFDFVYKNKPQQSKLTSFSVLFAIHKGDIDVFIEGANAIDRLTENDSVLIAEACTHNALDGDIGRIKIPALLRKKVGEKLSIDVVSGSKFPSDLSKYSLVIHCGACMFTKKYVLSRVEQTVLQKTPMTNYGIAIAKLSGILDKITV